MKRFFKNYENVVLEILRIIMDLYHISLFRIVSILISTIPSLSSYQNYYKDILKAPIFCVSAVDVYRKSVESFFFKSELSLKNLFKCCFLNVGFSMGWMKMKLCNYSELRLQIHQAYQYQV